MTQTLSILGHEGLVLYDMALGWPDTSDDN